MTGLEALRSRCLSCHACELGKTRTKSVFDAGTPEAEIVLVGEGPGQQEDLSGEPFVGAAGKLLDDMLSIIDLGRHNCYITNIVKCRPPGNRDPQDAEQDACIGYLREQLSLVQPRILVCLGRIAAKRLIRESFLISREHGQWTQKDGIWLTAIYHPSALLRDPSKRPETFSDLLSIREKVHKVCSHTP